MSDFESEEKEYIDYLLHYSDSLLVQNNRLLDESLLLKKKLEIAMKCLKKYEMPENFEGGVGSDYEEMMWDCKNTIKQIEGLKNEDI